MCIVAFEFCLPRARYQCFQFTLTIAHSSDLQTDVWFHPGYFAVVFAVILLLLPLLASFPR